MFYQREHLPHPYNFFPITVLRILLAHKKISYFISMNGSYCHASQRMISECMFVEVVRLPIDHILGRHLKNTNEHIVDVEYSPLLGGFVAVLSGGRGFFLAAPNTRFDIQVSYYDISLFDCFCYSEREPH